MSRRRSKGKGIFCLEGDWARDLRDRTSVKPALVLLESSNEPPVRFIHRDVGTVEEFEHYLRKWTQKAYSNYPILYLSFHGDKGGLLVGERRGGGGRVRLDRIEDLLGGRCKGRVIHFGACETLSVRSTRLESFLRRTRALAVCGYKKDVEWMKSTAFEILLLSEMQHTSFTRPGMRALAAALKREAPGLAKGLRFKLVIHP